MGEAASENGTKEDVLLKDCFESAKTYLQQVSALGEASGSLSHHWGALLAQTPCGPAAKQFQNACKELQVAFGHGSGQMLLEMAKAQERLTQNGTKGTSNGSEDATASPNGTEKDSAHSSCQSDKKESPEDFKVIASCFASLVSFHCQMLLRASESFAHFSKLDSSETSEGQASSEQDPLKCQTKSDPQGGANTETADGSTAKTVEGTMGKTADGALHKMVVGSPSGLRKLSTFLSKLGRSGSSPSPNDLSQSFFYVDMPDQGAGEHLTLTDKNGVKQKVSEHTAGGVHAAQHVIGGNNTKDSISQEELDSVIDFLSGFKVPMQTIHEHIPTQMHTNSRVVGSQLNHHKDTEYQAQHGERPGGKPYNKTKTWPYRISPKGAAEMTSPYSAFGLGEAAMADPEYWRYLNSVGNMKQGDMLAGRSAWNTAAAMMGEAGLNRSWPHQAMGQETIEGSGRGWSCATGDSSSCSDESSNGEAPWMMGLDLMNSVNSKRRHSSGEDGLMPTNHVAVAGTRHNPTDARPRSVEDLLEAKSNKTWPPKQPWMKGQPQEGATKEEGTAEGAMSQPVVQPQPYHPPLTMQWSDPLTNRPLSTWGTGLNPSLSNQGMANYGSGLL